MAYIDSATAQKCADVSFKVDMEMGQAAEDSDAKQATRLDQQDEPENQKASMKEMVLAWVSKAMGAGKQPVAGSSISETALTFIGVLLTLLVLSVLSEGLMDISENEYFLLLGNFGATMTLVFDIHKAPAAQPRNILLGSTVSASLAILLCYIPENILPVWTRVAVAPACSIAAMGKLGLSHPPAGAAALIYAQAGPLVKDLGWMYLILPLFVGNMITVTMATLINNLSKERHYPSYWAFTARTW